MPMHDWARVKFGIYHNFRYLSIAALLNRLNAGLLPSGFFAMAEQNIGSPEPDVVAVQTGSSKYPSEQEARGGRDDLRIVTTREQAQQPAGRFLGMSIS